MHQVVIAVYVSVSLNLLEHTVNAPPNKPIALARIAKYQMTQTKYALDMERVIAINVNAMKLILVNFVRTQKVARLLVHSAFSMNHVYSVQ